MPKFAQRGRAKAGDFSHDVLGIDELFAMRSIRSVFSHDLELLLILGPNTTPWLPFSVESDVMSLVEPSFIRFS
jgi:hypothetical protein